MKPHWPKTKSKTMTHKELIARMRSQPEYKEKYDEVAPEFELLYKILEARKRAGLTQERAIEESKK